jgi:hypothetical protein
LKIFYKGTEEQIKDAIETIRGKKDIVELAKRLKYFFGPKTINYGVREVTNQRTDAAKVVIKCFCIETRGRGEKVHLRARRARPWRDKSWMPGTGTGTFREGKTHTHTPPPPPRFPQSPRQKG